MELDESWYIVVCGMFDQNWGLRKHEVHVTLHLSRSFVKKIYKVYSLLSYILILHYILTLSCELCICLACSRRRAELEAKENRTVTLHCTTSGDYEPLQCDDGLCWCAEPRTGQPTVIPVPEEDMKRLPCCKYSFLWYINSRVVELKSRQ